MDKGFSKNVRGSQRIGLLNRQSFHKNAALLKQNYLVKVKKYASNKRGFLPKIYGLAVIHFMKGKMPDETWHFKGEVNKIAIDISRLQLIVIFLSAYHLLCCLHDVLTS